MASAWTRASSCSNRPSGAPPRPIKSLRACSYTLTLALHYYPQWWPNDDPMMTRRICRKTPLGHPHTKKPPVTEGSTIFWWALWCVMMLTISTVLSPSPALWVDVSVWQGLYKSYMDVLYVCLHFVCVWIVSVLVWMRFLCVPRLWFKCPFGYELVTFEPLQYLALY